ncbi:MAG: 6-carboxytetrahydropterin synthase [Candidatus Paceibacterota bacterium]|jgi:6-pyruvoyltetrahydropterin/6-carboxytetrahydropterin synthase
MYRLTREFYFSASHMIHNLENSQPESRLHGHNYRVKVEIKVTNANKIGFPEKEHQIFDKIKTWIEDELATRHLNDIFGGMSPTSENICHWLFFAFKGMFSDISAVELSEGQGINCRYEE